MPDRLAALRFRMACLTALLAGLLLALGAPAALAQKSPLGVPAPGTGQTFTPPRPGTPAPQAAPSPPTGFWYRVRAIQNDLHRRLAVAIHRLKRGEGLAAAWFLAGISFFYGVVHAVGPGHGKAVISSYVVANERTVRRGITLSFLASVVQALSAVALVGLLAVALNAAGVRIKAVAAQLETASYALIAVIGAWLLYSQLRALWRRRVPAIPASAGHAHHHGGAQAHHSHGHGHDDCGHAHMPDANEVAQASDWRSAAAIILAVGLRPCTGAIVVLVFALANGLFWAGVGATFAMSLGTAITVSALAVLAVGSRDLALRLAGPESAWADRILAIAAVGGSALVLLIGAVLFAGSLGPARPF